MWPSLKPSQKITVAGAINPQSSAAAVSTAWVPASQFANFLAVLAVGVISAGGTVNASLSQAQDANGTNAKAITGKAITALTQAGGSGNQQAFIDLKGDELDVNNGFDYVQLTVTPSGAAALISAQLLGVDPTYGPADTQAAASVVQVVY